MYTNLSLYYLQQMGITPWISKSACKLLVLVPAEQSAKAEQLLKKILALVCISEKEIMLERVQAQTDYSAMAQKASVAVLALGLNTDHLSCSCPVIATLSPDHLLQHAKDKKRVFYDIQRVNALLV